jgi:hypothetical protein
MHTATITKADRDALENLWGEAGTWAAATWTHLNTDHFNSRLIYHGIVFGLTPHGENLAHTWPDGRITLHPSLLDPHGDAWMIGHKLGALFAEDVLLHEMVHVVLDEAGVPNTSQGQHNTVEWCEQIMRITPQLGLPPILAAPVKPRRVDGKVRRLPREGYLSRADIAYWPHSLRPDGYFDSEGRIRVRI